jgi:hypothetical protein
MEPLVQVYWVPKLGNSVDEYEDAFAYSGPNRHLAIADGATESSYADRWAKDLVSQYVTEPPPVEAPQTPFPGWLTPMQQRWREGIDWENLPWFAEEKAKAGAYATFLGVSVFDPEHLRKASLIERTTAFFRKHEPAQVWRWKAVAVGDSCFFQIREGQLLRSFPLTRAEQFNSRPMLLCSNPGSNSGVWGEVRYEQGDLKPDDLFILATDAVAKWFLDQRQAGGKPWDVLSAIRSNVEFQDFIARLRGEKAMRNDDCTVLISQWKPSPKAERTLFFKKSSASSHATTNANTNQTLL